MATPNLPPFLNYYPAYHLLICSLCKKAIKERDTMGHLDIHSTVVQIDQASYRDPISSLSIKSLGEALQLIKAHEPLAAFSDLPPPREGYRCQFPTCSFISTVEKTTKTHVSSDHHVKNPEKQSNFISSCLVQSLTPIRFLFEIKAPDHLLDDPPTDVAVGGIEAAQGGHEVDDQTTGGFDQLAKALLDEFTTKKQQFDATQAQVHGSRDEANAFAAYTRVWDFLGSRNIDLLHSLLEIGDSNQKSDPLSTCLLWIFARAGARVPFLSRTSLTTLLEFSPDHANMKRFRLVQEHQTLVKYMRVLVRFLTFILNSFNLEVSWFYIY
jgi:hypothetical protein